MLDMQPAGKNTVGGLEESQDIMYYMIRAYNTRCVHANTLVGTVRTPSDKG